MKRKSCGEFLFHAPATAQMSLLILIAGRGVTAERNIIFARVKWRRKKARSNSESDEFPTSTGNVAELRKRFVASPMRRRISLRNEKIAANHRARGQTKFPSVLLFPLLPFFPLFHSDSREASRHYLRPFFNNSLCGIVEAKSDGKA